MRLILTSHYLGMLPSHLVDNPSLQQQLKPLFVEQYAYHNTFTAMWRQKHSNQQVVDCFIQCLQKAIAAH